MLNKCRRFVVVRVQGFEPAVSGIAWGSVRLRIRRQDDRSWRLGLRIKLDLEACCVRLDILQLLLHFLHCSVACARINLGSDLRFQRISNSMPKQQAC